MIDRQLPTTRVVTAVLYGFDGYFSDGYYGGTAWTADCASLIRLRAGVAHRQMWQGGFRLRNADRKI
jgi:hypothetical protein